MITNVLPPFYGSQCIILYKTTLQLGVRNLPNVFTRQHEYQAVPVQRSKEGISVCLDTSSSDSAWTRAASTFTTFIHSFIHMIANKWTRAGYAGVHMSARRWQNILRNHGGVSDNSEEIKERAALTADVAFASEVERRSSEDCRLNCDVPRPLHCWPLNRYISPHSPHRPTSLSLLNLIIFCFYFWGLILVQV